MPRKSKVEKSGTGTINVNLTLDKQALELLKGVARKIAFYKGEEWTWQDAARQAIDEFNTERK